jgi:uncharacterized protein
MAMVSTLPAPKDRKDAPDNARRCLVTGEMRLKDELIRFVIAPDQTVVPDLACNLPGRGLWVTATREAIETAVQKNLFAKAAKSPAKPDADLADKTAKLLRRKALDWLGLAKGAGIAVLGQTQVEAAVRARKIDFLLLADDATDSGLQNADSTGLATTRCFSRTELGAAFGYEQIVYAGLLSHSITGKLRIMLMHLEKIAVHSHLLRNTDSGMK